MLKKKIVVLGTGGTIAGVCDVPANGLNYRPAQLGIEQLVSQLDLKKQLNVDVHCEQLAQVDSKDMSHSIWQALALRVKFWLEDESVAGVVITHGTDTLEETAYFLQQTVSCKKPVVLTCAMRPANSLLRDGPQNLMDALHLASDPLGRGVMVMCAGEIHDALYVQKTHTHRLNAFDSGDRGALGQVRSGEVTWFRNPDLSPTDSVQCAIESIAKEDPQSWPWVAILTSHAGADERQIEALLAHGVKGLVVAGSGNATVHERLVKVLLRAQKQGVRVWLTTRCPYGGSLKVDVNLSESEMVFDLTPDLNAVKARIALMLRLLAERN